MQQQKALVPTTAAVNRAPVDRLGEARENKSTFDQPEARGQGPPQSFKKLGVGDVRTWLDRRRMGEHAAT